MSMSAIQMAAAERAQFERRARPGAFPIPLRGWYGDAENAEIRPDFAAILENMWIDAGLLKTRPGYTISDETIARQRVSYEFGAAPQVISCFPTIIRTGDQSIARACNSRFMTAELSSQTIMADGQGPIIAYNGSVFSEPVFTTDPGETQPDEFDGVIAHQNRLYFWKTTGPLEFWYSDQVGGVQGALTKFPLSLLGNIHGTIIAMGSLNVDTGDNVNNVLCIITSLGECVLYQGLNPSDPTDWRLSHRIRVAVPVSRFGIFNHGADLLVVTKRGLASIKDYIGQGTPAILKALTEPIQAKMREAINAVGSSLYWQAITGPTEEYLIVNVPLTSGHKLYVYGFSSGGWFEWNGFNVIGWRRAADGLYATLATGQEVLFGDAQGDDGAEIDQKWHTVWQRIGSNIITTLKPVIITAGDLELLVGVMADHAKSARDVDEAMQTVTLLPENETSSAAQPHYEEVYVGTEGDVFQLRLEFSTTYAEVPAIRWMR